MIALDVSILRKTFPAGGGQAAYVALQDLRFLVNKGQFVCVVGPSGTGKTTMLNIIAGLDTDFDGVIRTNLGEDGRRLVYMFQLPRLLPWRTVLENVELVLDGEKGARDVALGLINEVGLADFAHAYPGQISLGMQRRAALARAFALNPGILLMDEPFVSLDENAADGLRALLIKLWRSRPTTVLFVTHDTREAVKLATRILVFTPAPAKLAHDIPVTLSPLDRSDSQSVEAFRRSHPAFGGAFSVVSDTPSLNGRAAKSAAP
ncbi:MAG: ABC transporter ATP-binding protein [Hyphomicrobiales bacterium]|nr:ABC transporter ATP-binding protein [Hyphomicrobiales bacterium]